MKPLFVTTIAATLLLVTRPAPVIAQEQSNARPDETRRYTVIDLGTLPGGSFSQAYGLNNQGHVGGDSATAAGAIHATLWTKEDGMRDLGTLGGPNSSGGGPNHRDDVPVLAEVGTLDPNGENFCGFGTGYSCLGAVWRDGVMIALPTLGGNNGSALSINHKGQTAGLSENSVYDPSCSTATPNQVLDYEATIWDADGSIHGLAPLPGDSVGFALSINNQGEAVGSTGLCSNTPLLPLQAGPHAVLWERDGKPINLGSLGGSILNTAASINDRGEVVGGSNLSGNQTIHTFLWTKNHGMTDLGTVGADLASLPGGMGAINNRGQIVGESCDVDPLTAQTPPNCRAYLWQKGQMKDLNALIPAASPLYLIFGFGINDSGEIAGFAVVKTTGAVHAFLAVPCDEHEQDN